MSVFISWVILVIGALVFVLPWVLSPQGGIKPGLLIFGGLLTIILSAVSLIRNESIKSHAISMDTKHSRSHWPTLANTEKSSMADRNRSRESKSLNIFIRWVLVAVGFFVLVMGIFSTPEALRLSCIILGIVIALLSVILTQINTQAVTIKLLSRDGSVLMEASHVDWEEDCIVIKGKVLGSINTTAYFKPDEMWKSLSLVSPSLIAHFPVFIWKGWLKNRMRAK